MVLAGHLENGRDGLGVRLEEVSDVVRDLRRRSLDRETARRDRDERTTRVLVDEDDADVVAVGEVVEGVLDDRERGVALDDEKVRLVGGAVPDAGE